MNAPGSVLHMYAREFRTDLVLLFRFVATLEVSFRRYVTAVLRAGGNVLCLINDSRIIPIRGLLVVLASARARLIRFTIRLRDLRALACRTSTLNIPRV